MAMIPRRLVLSSALLLAFGGTGASAQQVLFTRGQWAAIQFGDRCEARSSAVRTSRTRSPGYAGFAFDPRSRVHGQFYARLSRAARGGSSIILTIGDRPFLLVGRGDWAWSRDSGQDAAIASAARYAGAMRVEARDGGGRRFVDRYMLDGAATAIDSAAARCAQAGKAR